MRSLLVLGGARSGKSAYAQKRCETLGRRLVYIATAHPGDEEMAERIGRHRADRGPCWSTIEAEVDLCGALADAMQQADAVLVDCLTLWLSNLMLGGHDIAVARDDLARMTRQASVPLVMIANEVGLSIVPDNTLARRFRDEAGWMNQEIAAAAQEVVLVTAGLPLSLKARRSDEGVI